MTIRVTLTSGYGTAGQVVTSNGDDELPTWETPSGGPSANPVGTVQMFASATPPTYWLVCNGAAVSRTTYAALFAVVSTTFGPGNGTTTFNLPDLVNRSPIGAGSTAALAATAGALTTAHTHGPGTLTVASHAHDGGDLVTIDHDHTVGTLAVASHTHSDGTLAVASHVHTSAGHTHTSAAHTHALSDAGQAQIMVDGEFDVHVRQVAVSSFTPTTSATSSAADTAGNKTSGAALRGATDSTTPADTGTTTPGNTGAATPDVTGATGSTAPSVSGSTASASGLSMEEGSTGVTAPAVDAGVTATTSPSVLHPVIGITFIIFAGV